MIACPEGQTRVEINDGISGGNGVFRTAPLGHPVQAAEIPRMQIRLVGFFPVAVFQRADERLFRKHFKGFTQIRPGVKSFGLAVEIAHQHMRRADFFVENQPRRAH